MVLGRGMMSLMTASAILDREEYIEQAYFFHILRDRLAENLPVQEVLEHIDQEILATTRLPLAIQFLATEVKHTGLLSTGFARLPHYFTAFQAFVIRNTEDETRRFAVETALFVLQREAEYRSGQPTPAGLFVYQFETLCRNRLGYDEGLGSMSADALYDARWRDYMEFVRKQIGLIDFADLLYVRSDAYVQEQRRQKPDYEPSLPPLFGTKEGRIARAHIGRDPLYLFAALQRQLGYPVVPRPLPKDDLTSRILVLQAKVRELELRQKLIESEMRGQVDLMQFGKPELLAEDEEDARS
jgi:hypothetical protein